VTLDALERVDGPAPPPPTRDGWELVLLENVAYLVDDGERLDAFERLRSRIGVTPEAILGADTAELASVCAGMRPDQRAKRLRRCAELRLAGARWRDYPGIGRPGVERIEMMNGSGTVLALDSNALRVLFRLGYGEPARSYDAMYRSAQRAVMLELDTAAPVLVRAHQLLRRHGQTRCRRNAPECGLCPLSDGCAAALGKRSLGDPFAT
jgi:endonuclease III